MPSRRQFIAESVVVAASVATGHAEASNLRTNALPFSEVVSLNGTWRFRLDLEKVGEKESWFAGDWNAPWHEVWVPQTWQIDPQHSDYRGVAWYSRSFDGEPSWRDGVVRIEFEAVFHTAKVWVNGKLAGEHARKGYTAFAFDITPQLRWDQLNSIVVRVDSAFSEHMLPRGQSSDWANDGGIFRPVRLLISPKAFVERVAVEAVPNLNDKTALVSVAAYCRNADSREWTGTASLRLFDDETGVAVATAAETKLTVHADATEILTLQTTLSDVKLWHFDIPHLYRIELQISDGLKSHLYQTTFGVRSFEIKDGKFHLNGEPVRLMGVERMAGSNPRYGMAEPGEWIEHDHCDLKEMNCVFTRVHWPQDQRVLDFCDRHGILMQLEVPAWGPDTFYGMGAKPDHDIVENGIEQLRELIQQNRNHPSLVVWGLCNEIGGQTPAAYEFAKRMLEEAKRLDPRRLCSYASHSLHDTPERDVAGLMDFIEANEYFGTWQPGDAHDLDRHLDKLHAAFPAKPIVISEYGYCACTPDRPEGDTQRIDILKTHTAVFRSKEFVGSAIFFCYNDYRTHVGDRGLGSLQQRVHGVVDVYGTQKPSYTVLRSESSPVESVTATQQPKTFRLLVKARSTLPAYMLREYKVRGVLYGSGDIPVESTEVDLPELAPGGSVEVELNFTQAEIPHKVCFDVIRPTGFSAYSLAWKP